MDINQASAEQLEQTFQVDGTRARYLVERRNATGAFRTWDDVKQVPGFEDKMVENLQAAGLTISGSRSQREGRDERAETRKGGLDVNDASQEDLERVFQMDGERARYFIDARNRIGRFSSWDQIKREVPSFEDGMIENLKRGGLRIGP